MIDIPAIFGSLVFGDEQMKERLPLATYTEYRECIESGRPLTLDVANVIASAMKDWAIEKGATHYTHWFQPMTGMTAEKHDSFMEPTHDGRVIMQFKGKSLVQGEPDASSFPSGGLRATFEARGYTAWDPTSPAFIKDNTLCIPTAFCSYSGEALDKKTPLLRSMDAINLQAMRILNLFGNQTGATKVVTTVGPEQEYFLIDRSVYDMRPDLVHCGRTLIGARPPKGQEMEDHYFGVIKHRVKDFMCDLNVRLWELGVYAKTEHNEAAPAQHELAPVFATAGIATDHNQLTMEIMKSTASEYDMVCLLHEKPFASVNGSGKHNNWALTTDTGVNLLEPGDTPHKNARFLLFLTAVIKAVDEYQDLLRISVASAGNDHRLGAGEAPPAIVSMFLGDELAQILECMETGEKYLGRETVELETGASVLPHFAKDTTDRNRTSPFAFTGNKFEFRMPGSSFSVAEPNIVLNTIVAESLRQFADELERAEDFKSALSSLIKRTISKHKRIIFNGNNYTDEWVREARERGLSNYPSTVDAIPHLLDDKNIALFTSHGVYSQAELESRLEIQLENYSKILHIEALTMTDMVRKAVVPAVVEYQNMLLDTLKSKMTIGGINTSLEESLIKDISTLSADMYTALIKLERDTAKVERMSGAYQTAVYYHDHIVKDMEKLRKLVDTLELTVGKDYWPYPTYEDMLYSIK
ncbi:MAG: glutamine synthetase III [Clostridia bacterium]|nr:glutamine synthetase III [Clostridia bacterium]